MADGIWIFVNEPLSKYRQRRNAKKHIDFTDNMLILNGNNNKLTVFRVTVKIGHSTGCLTSKGLYDADRSRS
jgi:hypothetical protein